MKIRNMDDSVGSDNLSVPRLPVGDGGYTLLDQPNRIGRRLIQNHTLVRCEIRILLLDNHFPTLA